MNEPHIAPLTAFVHRLRQTSPLWTPDFDPESGGIHSSVLLLLQSPGPKVSVTGFVSADNPDQTAENLSCLLKLAGLSRSKVLIWNIVPWQLSADGVVAPTPQHLADAAPATLELLSLLPALNVVVLVASKAELGWRHVATRSTVSAAVLTCPHPSPVNFSPRPEAAVKALAALVEAARGAKL